MGPPSEWNQAVSTAFKAGRKTNKKYSLKQAMFDAKKIYNKGANIVASLGRRQTRRRASANKGYKRRKIYRGGSGLNSLSPVTLNDSPKQVVSQSSAPQSSVPTQVKN